MKKLVLLLSLLCMFVCCKSKKITKSTELKSKNSDYEFYGPVKKLVITDYDINDSTEIISDKKPTSIQIKKFDKLGNLIRNKFTYQSKWMSFDAKYIFDENNKITFSRISYNTSRTNSVYKYEYNEGKLINSKEYDRITDNLQAVTKYKYDAEKLKSIEYFIKQRDSLQQIKSSFLNSYGITTEEIKYENSKIAERNLYDSIGRIMISYSGFYLDDSNPTTTVLYTYDKHGNIATKKDNAYSFKYEYDSYGNETVRYLFDSDLVFCPTGDCIIGIRYHVYEYDKKKNWIKKIEFDRQCIPKTIEIRTLEYY